MPKLLQAGIGFALGACAVSAQAVLVPTPLLFALALVVLPLLGACRAPWMAALCLGWAWCNIASTQQLAEHPDPQYLGVPVLVTGEIRGIPRRDKHATRFDLELSEIRLNGQVQRNSGTIRLRWYSNPPPLRPGDNWSLWVKLRVPRGYHNRWGIDYERHLFVRGIGATGYVLAKPPVTPRRLSQHRSLAGLRKNLADALQTPADGIPDLPAAGIVAALAVGERSAISSLQWRLLRRAGLSHLVAISGLHVSLAALFGFALGRGLWVLSGALKRIVAARTVGLWLSLASAGAYAALAGFPLPTCRALAMIGAFITLALSLYRCHYGNLLGAALLLLSALWPLECAAAGFWLSFLAVWLIFRTLELRQSSRTPVADDGIVQAFGRRCSRYLANLLYIQWALFLGLAPVLLFYFGEISLIAPIANLVAVPIFSFVAVPLVLAGTVLLLSGSSLAWYLLAAGGTVIDWTLALVAPLADSSFAAATLSPGSGVLAALSISAWFLLRVSRRSRAIICALLACCAGLLMLPERPAKGDFHLVMLDVGQGLAVVLRTRHHALLYDAGPRYGNFSLGQTVVLPYLRGANIRWLDLAIASHASTDHVGGLPAVRAGITVKRILTSAPTEIVGSNDCNGFPGWYWDGVYFEIMSAAKDGINLSVNDASCVLRISGRHGSALLTGDLERRGERALLARYHQGLVVDVLQVPHHGSNTSSTTGFLAATSPSLALLSRGSENRYGHPADEVIKRFDRAGIKMMDTALTGQLNLASTAQGWTIETWADAGRRFWHR